MSVRVVVRPNSILALKALTNCKKKRQESRLFFKEKWNQNLPRPPVTEYTSPPKSKSPGVDGIFLCQGAPQKVRFSSSVFKACKTHQKQFLVGVLHVFHVPGKHDRQFTELSMHDVTGSCIR